MRLDQLTLQNYRCFDSLSIKLHPKLTVLIAPNGAGKTTILDAARVALWPFVKGFDLGSQTGKAATVQISDVRLNLLESGNMEPQIPCVIDASGDWSAENVGQRWVQARERVKVNTSTQGDSSTKRMTQYAKTLEKQVRAGQTITLPLITYLGTSRLWYEGRFSVNFQANLTRRGCGGILGLLGGSSCTHTKTALEQSSAISSSGNALERPFDSWVKH